MFFILKIEPLFDYEAMKKRIDEYFNNITPEQLKKDMEDAGYEIYKNVDESIYSK